MVFVRAEKLMSKRKGSSVKLSFRKKSTDSGKETEVIHNGTREHA